MARSADKEIKDLLSQLTPDQQAIAEELTRLRVENTMLKRQSEVIKPEYDQLYRLFVVLLDAHPDRELRVHNTQFLRFNEEYRIDRSFDKKTQEMVFKLLTLRDESAEGGE